MPNQNVQMPQFGTRVLLQKMISHSTTENEKISHSTTENESIIDLKYTGECLNFFKSFLFLEWHKFYMCICLQYM